ncbi:MAG: hypothetical protein LBT54_05015 [Bifidobacteriaceae bacterium]|nr:hypothetical protein [Bifidobacteriaceae bacterium]
MVRHAVAAHFTPRDAGSHRLVKIEARYDRAFWLYVLTGGKTQLGDLDALLRAMWLECCGHMSAFLEPDRRGDRPMSERVSRLALGEPVTYWYDFGSTTELLVTPVKAMAPPSDRALGGRIAIIARNSPPVIACVQCGGPAGVICQQCQWDEANPMFCDACFEPHTAQPPRAGEDRHGEYRLPVVNSPRIGECGYAGGSDEFDFDPSVFA